jgi:4-hydroxybutyrate dehydrogenase/sulfolactaldehyde 3-reductase
MIQKIVMVGLGMMGAPMAHNMLAAGLDLVVCDTNRDALLPFQNKSVPTFAVPADAAKGRNVVITILPNSDIVDHVLFADNGILETLAAGSLIIEMSTGSYVRSMDIANRVRAAGHRFIDAPVGRTPREAATGNLLVMAGGSGADIEAATEIFNAVGDTTIHVGPTGHGLKAKLVNNYMAMVSNAVTADTLALAHHVGLDIQVMAKLMSTTTAGLGQLNTNYPKKVLAGDLTPDFPISMAIKDVNMAIELANSCGASAAFGTLARSLFTEAAESGLGRLDQTAILNHMLDRS